MICTFRKYLFVLLVIATGWSVPCQADMPPAVAAGTALAAADDCVVKVFKPNEQGTGTLISSDGWILTAAHAADYDPAAMHVEWRGRQHDVVDVFFAHAQCADLALVKIDVFQAPCLQIATENPRVQETVVSAGYPRGAFREAGGFVLRYMGGDRQTGFVMTSFVCDRGGSGSPLVNKSHKICGVLTTAAFDHRNAPIADFWIPAQPIAHLLDEARDAGKLATTAADIAGK